jgi:hypothetical protein
VSRLPQNSVGTLWDELNHPSRFPTPQVTVEAVLCSVRERGVAALKEPANLERLKCCDQAARDQIDRRIKDLIKKVPHEPAF